MDGELTVELAGELSVPFRLIQVPGEVRLSRLSARFRMDAEVGVSSEGVIGAVGAVVEVDDLITLVDNLDAANGLDPSLVALAGQVLRRNADFDPEVDAESSFSCTKMSMGLSAGAVPAFLLPAE